MTVAASSGGRRIFIDNLRWTVIVLVISMHAADTYSPFGSWYYSDKAATGRLAAALFGTYQTFLQSFFMGLLFAVSGYFARASLLRKGTALFLRDRLIRLGIPTVLYMLVIGPVTEYFVAGSWRPSRPSSFGNEWLKHILDGEVWSESGPLWFCVALLIFSTIYAVWRSLASASTPPRAMKDPTTANIAAFIGAIATGTFVARLISPGGLVVLNMQLGDFPQYALMFTAGLHAHRTGWLDRLGASSGRRWALAGVVASLVGWILIVWLGGALAGDTRAYDGGFTWQSAAKCLWEAWVCVSISLGLYSLYRARFDFQNALTRFLSDNAFAVYVFHPPILILVTRLLSEWHGLPGLKFVAAWTVGGAASFAFAALLARRTPILRQIL